MEIKNITMKSSWNDITVEDYINIISAVNSDSEMFEKDLLILSVLTELEYDDLLKVDLSDLKKLHQKAQFIKKRPNKDLQLEYNINGRKYMPKLNPTKFEAGRFIDICSLTGDDEQFLNNLHIILATLLDPIEHKWYWFDKTIDYGDKDIHEEAEWLFEHMPIEDAFALSDFFLINSQIFYKVIQGYSEDEKLPKMTTLKRMMRKLSQNDGLG